MPRYIVSATLSVPAWVEVEAENPQEAEAIAADCVPLAFEYDMSAAEFGLNITPTVTPA